MREYYMTPDGRTGCLVYGFARCLDDAMDLVEAAAREHRALRVQSFNASMPKTAGFCCTPEGSYCELGVYHARLEEVKPCAC